MEEHEHRRRVVGTDSGLQPVDVDEVLVRRGQAFALKAWHGPIETPGEQGRPDGLHIAAGQPPRRSITAVHQWMVEAISMISCTSCGVPGLAWCATMRQPCAALMYTLVAMTHADCGPSEPMTCTRSSTLCTALECVSTRRTFSGCALTAPLPKIDSKLARMAAAPMSRGPPGCTQAISSSSDHTDISFSMSPRCSAS